MNIDDALAALLRPSVTKKIHVNQHNIKANAKDGGDRPVLSVKTYLGNLVCKEVEVLGPSKLVYRPDDPLMCGARVWVETNAEVRVITA